jgi:Tol biopolymer transport system component
VNSAGTIQATQDSKNPSISANGRVVAFFSGDFNLAPPASGFQIYARDTCFGAPAGCLRSTVLVSADNTGLKGNTFSNNPSASGDGRFIAFESNSNNLVPTTSSIQQQIFLRDTCIGAPAGCTPKTTLTSANSTGSPSNNFNQSPSVNSDGRFVAFFSQASDILPGNTAAGRSDVFLRDTCGGSSGPIAGCTPSTIRVSIALDGTQANGASITGGPGTSISATGRFIAFGSAGTNLLPTPSTTGQVYVLDTCFGAPAGCTRALHKVTVDSSGNELGSSGQFGLSGDGKYLAFTKLVGTSPNQIQQIFLALTGF